jgi:hypothetical protein
LLFSRGKGTIEVNVHNLRVFFIEFIVHVNYPAALLPMSTLKLAHQTPAGNRWRRH